MKDEDIEKLERREETFKSGIFVEKKKHSRMQDVVDHNERCVAFHKKEILFWVSEQVMHREIIYVAEASLKEIQAELKKAKKRKKKTK